MEITVHFPAGLNSEAHELMQLLANSQDMRVVAYYDGTHEVYDKEA